MYDFKRPQPHSDALTLEQQKDFVWNSRIPELCSLPYLAHFVKMPPSYIARVGERAPELDSSRDLLLFLPLLAIARSLFVQLLLEALLMFKDSAGGSKTWHRCMQGGLLHFGSAAPRRLSYAAVVWCSTMVTLSYQNAICSVNIRTVSR